MTEHDDHSEGDDDGQERGPGKVLPFGRGKPAASSGDTPDPSGAGANASGAGGDSKGGGGRGKSGKRIDWGKFNYLVQNFALIYGTDTVWDGTNRMIMKIANMAHAHGSDVVKLWKVSEQRRTIMPTDVVFDPSRPGDHDGCVNLFSGMAMQPVEGDVQPYLELVRFLTSRVSSDPDECDELMHWLLCWIAYPLQHPGTKLRNAVVIHGDEGAGKNFMFDCIIEIYGRYGALVGQDELEDKFNDWRSGKMLVVGDEVSSRAELVHNKNRLKALVTSMTVQINPKNLPRREERNFINIVFLSNELQPLALDNSDRRYCVIYTPRAREFEFYKRLKEWKAGGGVAALYHYLLHYPLDGFDPYAPAPMTQAKRDLIDMNRKSPERFWRDWEAGELDLPYWSCSIAQAYQAYLAYSRRTGDRFPMQRNVFTRMVLRMAESDGKPIREKVMKIGDVGNKTCERMLLVADPPDGVPQGQWATECVEAFELALKKYLGYQPRSPGEGESGDGGAA